MEKQIINGLKMLQTKIKYNKFIFLVILTFLTPGAVFSSLPIAYLNTSGYEPAQQETAQGKNGMITTQHFLATAVGEKILNQGGNAYDASIAIAFTLAVVLPRAGNIGGGGFMVMYDKDTDNAYSIDYREKAPALAYKDMYLNDDGTFNDKKLSTFGYLSSGVPGTVAGMWEVHKKFGSLPWSELLKDAIYYAENGFNITPYMEDVLKNYNQKLSYYPETKSIFQKDFPNFTNKKLFQKDLANTLKIISSEGKKGFYEGYVAESIENDMKKNGGLITRADLKNYDPVWRLPLISDYRGNKVITMGPPSSGGVHIIQMLNVLENYQLNSYVHNSPEYINILGEVMKHAYSDRSKYLGDPDFFDVPIKKITSEMRRKAKAINFGIIYGISQYGLAKQIMVSNSEAEEFLNSYFLKFPEIKDYMQKTIKFCRSSGYVSNIFGRRSHITGINDKNFNVRNFQERAAINAPIQGSASEIMRLAMIRLRNKIDDINQKNIRMLLQIHDELVFEVKKTDLKSTIKLIKDEMTSVKESEFHTFSMPLIVDIKTGENWGELK